jgi:glycine/D-amino acid oxidase-like deaminating enzyme
VSAQSADVLVVGGGILGCSVAYYLAREGSDVLLIDRGEINGQASGRNAGSLHVQMLSHFLRQDDPQATELAGRSLGLHLAGVAEWSLLAGEVPDPIEMHVDGGLMVATNPAERERLLHKVELEQRLGIPVTLLDSEALAERAPYLAPGLLAAAFCAAEGRLNPALATPAIARAAIRFGARLCPQRRLLGLTCSAHGFLAHTEQGSIHAGKVINAAGPWADEVAAMLGFQMPVERIVLQMNVTEPVPRFLPHLVQHVGARLTLKQASNGNVIIGGGWQGYLDQADQAQLSLESIRGNLAVACAVVPCLSGLHLLRTWPGIVGRIGDGNPVLGAMPGMPGFLQALGIPNGYTLGPICGRLLAELVAGRAPSHDISQFSPQRFYQ